MTLTTASLSALSFPALKDGACRASWSAVSIVKDQWTTRSVGGFSPPLTVGGITANAYGYVTVTFGAVGGEFSGFYVFGPTGAPEEDGGGAQFSLNNINAVVPAALPF